MADARPTFPLPQRYTQRKQKQFSRPMTGHTPQKLPAQPQSPASSHSVGGIFRSRPQIYYHRAPYLSRVFHRKIKIFFWFFADGLNFCQVVSKCRIKHHTSPYIKRISPNLPSFKEKYYTKRRLRRAVF